MELKENNIDEILNKQVSNSQTLLELTDESDDRQSSYVDNLNAERLLIINNHCRGLV